MFERSGQFNLKEKFPALPPSLEGVDHVVSYYPGEEINVDIDLENVPHWISRLVISAQGYIRNPIIVDDFDRHDERRVWRNNLQAENPAAHEITENNRLRSNNVTALFAHLELVANNFEGDRYGDVAAQIHSDFFKNFTEEVWKNTSDTEKLDITQRLSEELKTLLRLTEESFSRQ